jgi:hypothetical protein
MKGNRRSHILYCVSRSIGSSPIACSRTKRLVPSPSCSAFRHLTVGGSCFWSPTSSRDCACGVVVRWQWRDGGSRRGEKAVDRLG